MDQFSVAVQSLRDEVAALRTEVAALRTEIGPILKWKTGLVSLFSILVALGFLARAVEWIAQLVRR